MGKVPMVLYLGTCLTNQLRSIGHFKLSLIPLGGRFWLR
jgi:hypothetical protein